MLISETAATRARSLSAVAAGLSGVIAFTLYFALHDGGWMVFLPVVVSAAATIWPTRAVVGIAMLVTSAIVVIGIEGSGVLFGASAAVLMLALNSLQTAATQVREIVRRVGKRRLVTAPQ